MADQKISELTELAEADWATGDELPIVDTSEGETKRTTVADFDARFATAAQGALADTATQPGDLGTLAAVDDAPSDGTQYARQDGTWVETAATGSGGDVVSVNSATGIVVLDADDIDDSATINKFTTAARLSKLDAIEELADVTDATNVAAAGAVMTSGNQMVAGVKTFSSAPLVPGPTSEFEAATKGYVDTTALLDSEVDADIKTLSLPANTTISTFGASLVDDADAAAARTTLGVPAATTVAPTVVLTQAEYDALTPDSETIYYIVG